MMFGDDNVYCLKSFTGNWTFHHHSINIKSNLKEFIIERRE